MKDYYEFPARENSVTELLRLFSLFPTLQQVQKSYKLAFALV